MKIKVIRNKENAFGCSSRNGWRSFTNCQDFLKPSLSWPEDLSQAPRYYSPALLAMLLLAQPRRFQSTVTTAVLAFGAFLYRWGSNSEDYVPACLSYDTSKVIKVKSFQITCGFYGPHAVYIDESHQPTAVLGNFRPVPRA